MQCIIKIILSPSAWLRDCILGCIVLLFDCSLSSLKQITVTSAVHERCMSVQNIIVGTEATNAKHLPGNPPT